MPLTLRDHLKRDGWIPLHSFHGKNALADEIIRIGPGHRDSELKESVRKLKHLIENDPELYMGFIDMFKEAGRGSLVGVAASPFPP